MFINSNKSPHPVSENDAKSLKNGNHSPTTQISTSTEMQQQHMYGAIAGVVNMQENIREMLREHIDTRIYHMHPNKTYVFEWLMDESLLATTTELEQMFLERMLNLLIVSSEADVGLAGLNEEGKTLYQRVV